jgi:hypothetical protein
MMHPINSYRMVQMYQEERRRKTEHGRLVQTIQVSQRQQRSLRHTFVLWFGNHVVKWGQRLVHIESREKASFSPSASPHH